MSAQSSYRNTKAEEYARWRRRDHANIEAMQNLVVARISEESGIEMPSNVRCLVSALQGAHGGGEVAFEPFERSYLTLGAQLQFKGNDDAIKQRVRRWVDELLKWQLDTGFEWFSIVKGGDIIGTHPDGTPIRKLTVFIDNIKPHADDAVQRARASELWKGNAQKRIKPHPGKALTAQVESLLKALPKIKAEPKPAGEEGKTTTKQGAGEYAQKREDAIVKALEDAADGIEERDGDADLWLEKIEKVVRKMRDSRRKTAPARRSWIMPSDDEDEEAAPANGSSAYMGITQDAQEGAALGIIFDTQSAAKTLDETADFDPSEGPKEADDEPCHVLPFALEMAAAGIRVFPLYGVADGICDCPDGSECRSAGKHPIPSLTPQGVKNATTDRDKITKWFSKVPHANYGWAMGGELRLVGVDVDPRSGGDTSLCDLQEAHGDEWLKGFCVLTGSLGNHFPFRLPEGVEFRRAKLAPGIDLKFEGGYLVGPGSMHVSGRRYAVEQNEYISEAPAWLVEELMRAPDEPPKVPVDFQAYRDRKSVGTGPAIVEGERNVRLFKVGCALWGKGEVAGRSELFQKLMEANVERVSPPLDSDEVYKIAESLSRSYALGVPIKEEVA